MGTWLQLPSVIGSRGRIIDPEAGKRTNLYVREPRTDSLDQTVGESFMNMRRSGADLFAPVPLAHLAGHVVRTFVVVALLSPVMLSSAYARSGETNGGLLTSVTSVSPT
jgi:hypothetical protein